jgi:hypothetical protein
MDLAQIASIKKKLDNSAGYDKIKKEKNSCFVSKKRNFHTDQQDQGIKTQIIN